MSEKEAYEIPMVEVMELSGGSVIVASPDDSNYTNTPMDEAIDGQ